MNSKDIVVIGTGMSALGSIFALIEAGIKPTVIDAGSLKDIEVPEMFSHLKKKFPKDWLEQDRSNLINTLRVNKREIPKKLSFGSSDVYGTESKSYRGVKNPAYSHFVGGFSHVWGGSALITPVEEFRDWPILPKLMTKYFEKSLEILPYAANSSGLDVHFGKPKFDTSLNISAKDKVYLDKLSSNLHGDVFVGQSRLLVHSTGEKNCRYCGFCMTGCVYSSIFKSSEIISQLKNQGKIELLDNYILHRFSERRGIVSLELYSKKDRKLVVKNFDVMYLGAGASETTRIILNSVKTFNSVNLHGRGSCIVPLLSLRSKLVEWPSVNTLPAIFIEFRDTKLGAWTHVQMTNQNEFIYKTLGFFKKGKIPKWRRFIAANISTLMINNNAEYGVLYTFTKHKDNQNEVSIEFSTQGSKMLFLYKAFKYSLKIAVALKIVPLFFLTKMNYQTYHIGGSFPMRTSPSASNETDTLGRLTEFENVHIIDSSAFPSIPSTTIGILLTANAWRITDESISYLDNVEKK